MNIIEELEKVRMMSVDEIQALKEQIKILKIQNEGWKNRCQEHYIRAAVSDIAVDALEKIVDPRKRDHLEKDNYTEVACLTHIANEALMNIENEKLVRVWEKSNEFHKM